MDEKKTVRETYDKIVKEYDQFSLPVLKKHYDKFMKMLPRNSDILDIGCASGKASKHFTEHGHNVLGIDISKNMIHYAKEKVPTAEFMVMDAEEIDISRRFDGIWASFVLAHIKPEKHHGILKNLLSILKPNGIIFLGMLEGKGAKILPDPRNPELKQYYVFAEKDELIDLMNEVGFAMLDYTAEDVKIKETPFRFSFSYATKN